MNIKEFLYQIGWLKRKLGLIPQVKDDRDYPYRSSGDTADKISLRLFFPNVTQQNGYNSCVAHSVCALLDYLLNNKKETAWDFNSSEAYLWAIARQEESTLNENTGLVLRDTFKAIEKYGFVPQEYWDYKDGIYTFPNNKALIAADFFRQYVQTLPSYYTFESVWSDKVERIKNALTNGYPVVFGFPVDSAFMKLNSENFIVSSIKDSRVGYHAMLIIGYNETGFEIRNSWGRYWGKDGHCYISEQLIKDESFDTWTLKE